MILCPKGHHQVEQTGSVRASVGQTTVKINDKAFTIPPRENVTLHYKCRVCGARFSIEAGRQK